MIKPSYIEALELRIAPATFIVTSLADSGAGTLRDAIEQANATAGADEIIFQSIKGTPLKGTIKLASDLPTITDDLTISGPIAGNASVIKIDGAKAFRPITIVAADVQITDLTIQNGFASKGGGIYINNTGELVLLENLVISKNRATSDTLGAITFGGGIYIGGGDVRVKDSIITGNVAAGTVGNSTKASGGAAYGGGIFSKGDLSVEDSIVSKNSAIGGAAFKAANANAGGGFGGGIYQTVVGTTLSVIDSKITGNRALGGTGAGTGAGGNAAGGGVYIFSASGIVETSLISKNSVLGGRGTATGSGGSATGGALVNAGNALGDTEILSSTLTGNSVKGGSGGSPKVGYGGGIYSRRNLAIESSILSANKGAYGGALYHSKGSATISESTLTKNSAIYGGGIYLRSGAMLLTNSTLFSNKADYGGGIYHVSGKAEIIQSTLATNSAKKAGGAIYKSASTAMALSNSTISGNTSALGGGVALYGGATAVDVVSTIIAQNRARTDADFSGALNATNSLIGAVTTGTKFGVDLNNLINTSALLGKLANNGGPTLTMLPTANSPVIDAGSNPLMLTTDQRGSGFPRETGAATDIGAVERPSS